MKKKILLFLLFINCLGVFGQNKRFQFELGYNYPIGLERYGNEENRVGIYFNGIYKIKENPLDLRLKLSYESYTTVLFKEVYENYSFNARSLSLVGSANQNYNLAFSVNFYAGIGLGISFDNIGSGVFNPGFKTNAVVVPQIGFEFLKHINLSAQYYITQTRFSRLMIGLGYRF